MEVFLCIGRENKRQGRQTLEIQRECEDSLFFFFSMQIATKSELLSMRLKVGWK